MGNKNTNLKKNKRDNKTIKINKIRITEIIYNN